LEYFNAQGWGYNLLNEYFVSISRGGKPPQTAWYLYANGFKSEKAAKLAGEKALRELLDGVAGEQSKRA
jgi:hypothetical protein